MSKPFHSFRKKWGQNFLNDTNLLNKIVKVISPHTKDSILEIGAGWGGLTNQLSKIYEKKVARAKEFDACAEKILNLKLELSN